jgi:uncharacterized membrane protein
MSDDPIRAVKRFQGTKLMRKTLETICLAALTLMAWVTWAALYGHDPLPATIATHFDMAGHANGWGSSKTLLLLPAVALSIYLVMTAVALVPGAFNYPVQVTAENRPRLQKLSLEMIDWLKVEILCLLAWLQNTIIGSARHSGQGMTSVAVLVPVSIAVIFATIAGYFVAMWRAARPGADL